VGGSSAGPWVAGSLCLEPVTQRRNIGLGLGRCWSIVALMMHWNIVVYCWQGCQYSAVDLPGGPLDLVDVVMMLGGPDM